MRNLLIVILFLISSSCGMRLRVITPLTKQQQTSTNIKVHRLSAGVSNHPDTFKYGFECKIHGWHSSTFGTDALYNPRYCSPTFQWRWDFERSPFTQQSDWLWNFNNNSNIFYLGNVYYPHRWSLFGYDRWGYNSMFRNNMWTYGYYGGWNSYYNNPWFFEYHNNWLRTNTRERVRVERERRPQPRINNNRRTRTNTRNIRVRRYDDNIIREYNNTRTPRPTPNTTPIRRSIDNRIEPPRRPVQQPPVRTRTQPSNNVRPMAPSRTSGNTTIIRNSPTRTKVNISPRKNR